MKMIKKRSKGRAFIGLVLLSAAAIISLTGVDAGAAETRPLKIALLPILDAFPFYVAESKGYFSQCNVAVTPVPVASGLERDQLMQSGEIDGMLNEMMSTANFNREQPSVRIVAAARKAYPDYPLFRMLAAPGSGIDTPSKLAGVAVGISKNTIIEYVTDRLLEAEHLQVADIRKISVPVIPERYQLLMQGQLLAANLPDPLAKSAMAAGAILVVDDARHPRYAMSVLSFSLASLRQRPADVRNFLRAWDLAAADINADPQSHRSLLLTTIRVPKNIEATYQIPPYPRHEVPDADSMVGRDGLDGIQRAPENTAAI